MLKRKHQVLYLKSFDCNNIGFEEFETAAIFSDPGVTITGGNYEIVENGGFVGNAAKISGRTAAWQVMRLSLVGVPAGTPMHIR